MCKAWGKSETMSSKGCTNQVMRGGVYDAAVKDVQAMLREEECVSNTGHTSNDAEAKVVQAMLKKEECAFGMVQCKRCSSEGCTNKLGKEDCA